MSTTTALREKRQGLIAVMSDAVKQETAATLAGETTRAADWAETFRKAEADERAIGETLQRLEVVAEAERREAEVFAAKSRTSTAAAASTSPDEEYRSAFDAFYRAQRLTPEQLNMLEKRGTSTQVVGTTTLGGYLVPPGYLYEIERKMASYSGILQAASVFYTDMGNTITMPTEDDTSTSAVLIAEAGAFTIQDLTFGQIQFDAYKYGTAAKVSYELMQDAGFDVGAEITNSFSSRFGRKLNTDCTTGDGSGKPNGVVTASTLGKTAASASAITFNEMLDLLHSVDPAYRDAPNCGFMMHDNVLAALKKIQLGTGDVTPLWMPSVREGEPDKILGKRYWINQGMASSIATATKVVLFGDFSKYRIRIVKDMTVVRLNELYAANGLVGYQAYMRFDGELVNSAAVKHLVTA